MVAECDYSPVHNITKPEADFVIGPCFANDLSVWQDSARTVIPNGPRMKGLAVDSKCISLRIFLFVQIGKRAL